MARKKQEIQLQREIETQEEWEEVMALEGVWVIDVYQEWCGPCQALVGNFRRLKNELGDPLLNFAIAKADTIDALEKYRGRCEPTFLFYAGGILTSYIHGANAPKVQRVITEQLAQEHKVLEGTGERKEVKDSVITRSQEIENEKLAEAELKREAEDGDEENKGVTVAIIKPDAVAQGKDEEIINDMKEQGIEILAEDKRELTEEEARQLYAELEGEDYFEELIKFMTSGPSVLLVLTAGDTGETIIKDWRNLIGPKDVEKAKEEAPNSMRAKYGEKGYMNALHGSSTADTASKELAFFFPNLTLPTYKKKKQNIQRTLALIRPEAFNAKKEEILQKIKEAGFKIAMYKEVTLTKEQAAEFYKEHEQFAYFDQLVEAMSSGPLLALGLARDEAIQAWRDMLGPANVDEAVEKHPQSLRAQFVGTSGMNQIHGSDSEEAAKKELQYFFDMEQTVGVIKPSGMEDKDEIIKKIHESGFRIAANKEMTITRDIAEMLYPNHKNEEYYEDLIESMISGPTLFMVLSREDAVHGWRRDIGPTNPEEAKTIDPNTLRAQYGIDIINNALHGSSDPEHAKKEMRVIFGDLQFNPDGTVKGEMPTLDETAQGESTAEETTMDETAADQTADTTQDVTADETQNVTADETQNVTSDETQNVTADETQDVTADESTVADTTTAGDTTTADETAAGETTTADETAAGDTAGETQGETTQAEDTQGDTTQAETSGGDASAEATSAEPQSAEQTQEKAPDAPAEQDKPKEEEAKPAETQQQEAKEEEKKDSETSQQKDETADETKAEGETAPATGGEATPAEQQA